MRRNTCEVCEMGSAKRLVILRLIKDLSLKELKQLYQERKRKFER